MFLGWWTFDIASCLMDWLHPKISVIMAGIKLPRNCRWIQISDHETSMYIRCRVARILVNHEQNLGEMVGPRTMPYTVDAAVRPHIVQEGMGAGRPTAQFNPVLVRHVSLDNWQIRRVRRYSTTYHLTHGTLSPESILVKLTFHCPDV